MALRKDSLALYFALLATFSVPFWVVGSLTSWQPLPGLPVSAMMFVCPFAAAAMLVRLQSGRIVLGQWLSQALALGRALRHVPAALLLPMLGLGASYLALRFTGAALPAIDMDYRGLPLVLGAFLVTGLLEQLGWSAYATRVAQERHSAIAASVWVGLGWAVWHFIPLLQAGRSIVWIAWWCLMTVSLRVLLTWLYNSSSGSVIAVAVCQASANTGWQYFPNYGSHYDPRTAGLAFAVLAAVVVAVYGPRRLARQGDL